LFLNPSIVQYSTSKSWKNQEHARPGIIVPDLVTP
jgi:hypothetical protein